MVVVVAGFYFSISTVGYSVLFLRGAAGALEESKPEPPPKRGRAAPAPAAPTKRKGPFSEQDYKTLLWSMGIFGGIFLGTSGTNESLTAISRTLFLGSATTWSYIWAATKLPAQFSKVVHPLLTSTMSTWVVMSLAGIITGESFESILRSYKTGTLSLVGGAGPGDYMMFLLGPSVVSFALGMYQKRKLLADNLLTIAAAMLISSGGGLLGTAVFVRLLQFGGSVGRLSVLPRNVTTALGMAMSKILGGDISIAAVAIVFTGVFGASFGRSILDGLGIEDPITRGLGMGCAGQGLSVAAMSGEPDAFPFAAIGMVLTAVCGTVLVSIPAVKDTIVSLAGAS